MHCRIVSSKTTLARGVRVEYLEIEARSRLEGVTTRSRCDRTGRTYSIEVPPFELRLEPEKQAKNIEYSQDLFLLGLVKVDSPIGAPERVTGLVLEVTGKEA